MCKEKGAGLLPNQGSVAPDWFSDCVQPANGSATGVSGIVAEPQDKLTLTASAPAADPSGSHEPPPASKRTLRSRRKVRDKWALVNCTNYAARDVDPSMIRAQTVSRGEPARC